MPIIGKAVDLPNEHILFLDIGEELHIPLTAVKENYGEAGHLVLAAVIVQDLGKTLVHLLSLSRLRSEPLATVTLGVPFGRYQKAVGGDIALNSGQSTRKSFLLKPLQTHLSVGNAMGESFCLGWPCSRSAPSAEPSGQGDRGS